MRLRKAVYATTASLIVLPLLTACVAPFAKPRAGNQATINLQVVPDADEHGAYKVQKNGRLKCPTQSQGCIRVPIHQTATITFTLTNADAGWSLTKFTLCLEGEEPPCKLTFRQRADFAFTADGRGNPVHPDENGVVDLTKLASGGQFVIDDSNRFAQKYEYTIEACNKKGSCTKADPPLDNEG